MISTRPISPLRQRMIDDMTVRRFAEKTQRDYIRDVETLRGLPRPLARHGHAEDLRRFQLHQTEDGVRRPTHEQRRVGAALLLHRDARPARSGPRVSPLSAQPRKLPLVLSPDGGGAAPRGGAGPQVQGRAERRPMAPGCAWPRSSALKVARYRQRAHAASGSSRARAARIATPCCRRTCSAPARLVARWAPQRLMRRRAGCFPGQQPGQADHHAPAQPRRPSRRRRPPRSPSG